MAKTPDIAVRVRADGVTRTIATFKAMQASVSRSLALVARSAEFTQSTLATLAKPIQVTVRGLRDVARTTAGVAALAAALAGIEGGKDLDAGNAVTSMKAGIEVAIDRTAELRSQLAAARAELKVTPDRFAGPVLARVRELEFEMATTRDTSAQVEVQWRRNIAVANELGVEIEKVGPGFNQLANATKGTALAGQKTDEIFRAMLSTSRALGQSGDETARSLTAVAQIAAKGKYSDEEAIQLAEAGIPANKILQAELGVTAEQFAEMKREGISAEVALSALSSAMSKQFGGKAAELAKGPAASFARLKNSIFLARSEIANGGLSESLARIAQNATVMIDRMAQSGQLAAIGARIGASLERLPGILGTIVDRLMLLGRYAREWWRQMGVAIGLDMGGWGDRTAGSLGTVLDVIKQLAFDIPGIIYALRMAFSGQDEDVAQRYAWILPIRDLIVNQVMPALRRVPQLVREWGPAFMSAAQTVKGILETIHGLLMAVFGNETGRKILAFLVIAKVVGVLNLLGGALSLVFAGIRAIAIAVIISKAMGALNGLAAAGGALGTALRALLIVLRYLRLAFLIFALPAGVVALVIAALAALAYAIYANWDTIKVYLAAVVAWIGEKFTSLIETFKSIGSTILDWLKWPFVQAWDFISGIFEKIRNLWNSASWANLLKGGEIVISSAKKAIGLATGGYVRGPGTTTSDSIPAWLSNREGVVNAPATEHYGGKRFIDSLNNMTFTGFGAPADVIEVSSGGTGRPMSFVMPGVGAASGRVDDDFANGMKRVFDKATAGRARQAKPRGHR